MPATPAAIRADQQAQRDARKAAELARVERAIDRLIRALRHAANATDVESLRWRACIASPALHAHAVRHAVCRGLLAFAPHHTRSHRGLVLGPAADGWRPTAPPARPFTLVQPEMGRVPMQAKILALLNCAQPQSTQRIADHLGVTRGDAGFVLNLMRAAGHIRHAKIADGGEGRGWKLARPIEQERANAA